MVLKGCTSRWPSPVSANAVATASTSPAVLTWSPRTTSAGPDDLWWRLCLAGAAVAANAKTSENEAASRLNERTDMNEIPSGNARERAARLWRNRSCLRQRRSVFARRFDDTAHSLSTATRRDSSLRPAEETVAKPSRPDRQHRRSEPQVTRRASHGDVASSAADHAAALSHRLVSVPVARRAPAPAAARADAAKTPGAVAQGRVSRRY